MTAASYSRRKARNSIWTVLAYAATALGLALLAIMSEMAYGGTLITP